MMTPEDLGRMSTEDIRNAKKSCAGRDSELWTHLHGETDARLRCFRFGRAGESAIASRAQVRAALGPLLRANTAEKGHNDFGATMNAMHNETVRACARAILGLAADATSPLEDSE